MVEQELPTLPEHPSSPPVFSAVRVARSLVLCVCFVDYPFVLFLLVLVSGLSFLLWFMDSDYLFGISKLFIKNTRVECFVEDVVMTCLEQENNLKRVFHRPPTET